MASKLYATESLIYRTVGYFEERKSQLSAEEQKDGKAIAASIAEYAIECSINKVVGSEVLRLYCRRSSSTSWWIWFHARI